MPPGDFNIKKLTSNFKLEAVKEIMKLHFSDSKTRLSDDTLLLVMQVLHTLTVEATLRAGKQARLEESTRIQLEHVEKILPQLMLDFV
ncbi:hypothetical protein C0J52_26702 [Blattella germanica]|nr:hypothetical protein C0J52_26702 [Blattella germanica]